MPPCRWENCMRLTNKEALCSSLSWDCLLKRIAEKNLPELSTGSVLPAQLPAPTKLSEPEA
jgi:hypothetical protein